MAIELQSFCANSQHEVRSWMHAPFRIGQWVYATNGHYCLRVPATTEPETDQNVPRNIASLFDKAFDGAEFLRMPAFAQAPICTFCNGDGKNHDPSYEEEDCPECFGRGFQKWLRTSVGDAEYELGYLNKMQTLPQARICTHGHTEPMAVLFNGGQALLMPMTKE